MSNHPRSVAAVSLLALVLTGCAGGQDKEAETSSPSSSATESAPASASPSETAASSQEPSAAPSPEAAPVRPSTEVPVPQPPEEPAPEDADAAGNSPSGLSPDAQAFFAAGGACNSDYFPTGTPGPELLTELQDYCAAQAGNQSGYPGPGSIDGIDTAPGYLNQDGDGTTDPDGYQRPAADDDGYVGPSEEFYGYDGYVEPGFEYQVGSECFDADLGRCKTSGEIQTEYFEGQEVEDIMAERGIPLPSEQ